MRLPIPESLDLAEGFRFARRLLERVQGGVPGGKPCAPDGISMSKEEYRVAQGERRASLEATYDRVFPGDPPVTYQDGFL